MKRILFIFLAVILSSLSLQSQTLKEYLQVAADNNPGLKAEYLLFESHMERIPQVGSLPEPQVSFGFFLSAVETRVGPQRFNVSLVQRFPWFGTLEAKKSAVAATAQAKFQVFLNARNQLFLQIALAYYELFEIERTEEIQNENIVLLESFRTLALKKLEHGKSKLVDVLRLDIMLEEAKTELAIVKQKKRPVQIKFNSLLNRPALAPVSIPDSLLVPTIVQGYRKDSMVMDHPQLKAIDYRIQSFVDQEQLAQKQSLPSFTAGITYINVGQRSDATPLQNGKDAMMPMVGMTLPIFKKKYQAAEQESLLKQKALQAGRQDLENQLQSEYENVWFAYESNMKLLKLYDQQLVTIQQTMNLLTIEFQHTGKEFEEVLRMQQTKLTYELKKVKAMVALHGAEAKLDYFTAKELTP